MSLKKLDALRKRAARRVTNADELLTEIRRLIIEEPKRYNQRTWVALREVVGDGLGRTWPACNTVGCVAGWVCHLSFDRNAVKGFRSFIFWGNDQPETITYAGNAQRLLGLTDAQAKELFKAHAAGQTTRQTHAHARAGAKHIRAFQKKYQDQLRGTPVEVRL